MNSEKQSTNLQMILREVNRVGEGQKNVPKLRFKGYEDAWEQRKFGDVGTVAMCKRIFKEETSENGEVPFYKIGTFGGEPDAYISREVYEKYKTMYPYPKKGDILISASGSIGRTVEYTGKDEYFQDSNIVWLQHNKNIDNSFLKVLYSVVQWSCEGSTIKRLYNDNFLKTNMVIPNIKEQMLIGECFGRLDNLITLHQRKYYALKSMKKTLLSKMFPKNGEDVPEIRFKGFTDAWEQRKLHECADFRRGSFPQPYGNKEWFDGKGAMPFVQVADVTDDMKLVQNTKQQISKLAQPMSVLAERGSVLVTLQGSIGRVAISQYNAFIDRTILVFDNYKIDIDKSFWAYVVKGKFADEKRKAPGGTIKTITKEVLSSFDLVIPSFNEQEDIGEFLVNLDQLITLHQRKLDELKNMKKTLLQQMFV